MEQKLAFHSRQAIDRNTRDAINKMSSTLQTRAQRFNGKSKSTDLFNKSLEINSIWLISVRLRSKKEKLILHST